MAVWNVFDTGIVNDIVKDTKSGKKCSVGEKVRKKAIIVQRHLREQSPTGTFEDEPVAEKPAEEEEDEDLEPKQEETEVTAERPEATTEMETVPQ